MADDSANSRSSIRKAAVVIASLGTELATRVCAHLDENLVRAVAEEVARLETINGDEYTAILRDFSADCGKTEHLGGIGMAQEILSGTLGTVHSNDLLMRQSDRLDPLRQMAEMDPQIIARRLEAELTQTAAVLISQLSAAKAAAVLQSMPPERRADILARAANLQPLAPGTLQAIAGGLEETFVPAARTQSGVPDNSFAFLMDMVSTMDRQTQQLVLADLREAEPGLAAQIEGSLFTFEDIPKLPDRALQTVLRAAEPAALALALKGLDEETRQRITANLSERARQALDEELHALGPVRVSEVENARAELAALARTLEEQGEITIDYGDEAYIE